MSAPNLKYRSGNFSVATPVGAIRNESSLLPESNGVLIFRQDFRQLVDDFVAAELNANNTDDPTIPNVGAGVNEGFLVDESPREDMGGGEVKWTRTVARVPLAYTKAGGIYNYRFPGYDDGGTNIRDPITWPVACVAHRSFFLVGNHGTYPDYATLVANELIKAFQPYDTDPSAYVDSLDSATTPTAAAYLAMIAAGTEIVVEDSKIIPWIGNIYLVETLYARAL